MKNKELQETLKKFPDNVDIVINHPEGDWEMRINSIVGIECEDENNNLEIVEILVVTDFSED